jgi:hypothetical protein
MRVRYVFNVTVYHFGDTAALSQIKVREISTFFVVFSISSDSGSSSSRSRSPASSAPQCRSVHKAWYATPPWLVEFVRLVIVIVNCGYLAGDKTLSDFRSDHGYLVTTTLITCLFVGATPYFFGSLLTSTFRSMYGIRPFSFIISACSALRSEGQMRFPKSPTGCAHVLVRSIRQLSSIIMWSVGKCAVDRWNVMVLILPAETSLVICMLAVVSLALVSRPGDWFAIAC